MRLKNSSKPDGLEALEIPPDLEGTVSISIRTEVKCSIPGIFSSAGVTPEISVTCPATAPSVAAAVEYVLAANTAIIRKDLPAQLDFCAKMNAKSAEFIPE